MNDISNIRDRLIKKAFTELMGKNIQVSYQSLDDALLDYGSFKQGGFYIEVDKTLKEVPVKILEGGMAHELSHIVKEKNLDRGMNWRDKLAYRISILYKTLDERNTDLQVILRGYGEELLAFLEYAEKQGYEYYTEDGLSVLEIKILFGKEIK